VISASIAGASKVAESLVAGNRFLGTQDDHDDRVNDELVNRIDPSR
jgi:hypothetical protein